MSGDKRKVIKIEPADSIITKIIANYDPTDMTTGFRLINKEN